MARPRQEINIQKVAQEANVSASTVSRVLNRRTGVSEENRARISAIIAKYSLQTRYDTGRAHKIAVLSPMSDISSYLAKAIKGIMRFSREQGAEIGFMISTHERRSALLGQIRDQQYSGVVVLLPSRFQDEHAELVRSELPVVFVDARVDYREASYIDHDSFSGACAAAEHLIALGHKKIGYLRHMDYSASHVQRYDGYQTTMRAAQLPIQEHWISSLLAEDFHETPELATVVAARRLLRQAPELTAVLAVNDTLALGALTAIREIGKRVPEDISVVGFDNYPESAVWYPGLTTVDHPVDEAGYLAVRAVYEAIENPQAILPRMTLPAHLVVRKSTARPSVSSQ